MYLQNSKAPSEGKDFMALVTEYRNAHGCSVEAAMKAVIKAHPEKHRAFIALANQASAGA